MRLRPSLLFTGRYIHRRFPRISSAVPSSAESLSASSDDRSGASVTVSSIDSPLLFLYPYGSRRSGGLRWLRPLAALEIILGPGHGFLSHFFLMEKIAMACCPVICLSHLNEFVLHSTAIIVPVAPVLLSIREEDFLASIHPECCVSSIHALQDSWSLLLVPVSPGSQPVRGPVLLDCRLLRCSSMLQRPLRGLRPMRFRFSSTCPLAGPRLLGGRGHKERSGSALALSLSRDRDKEGVVRSRTL